MASITVSSKNWLESLRLFLVVACLGWLTGSEAAEIEVSAQELLAVEEGYQLTADFAFEFGPRLEEAVAKGVVLHFVAEFEMTRGRWYWFDEKVVSRSQTIRLSYHALTRQYRLSTGALHQSVGTLSEALRMLSRLRNWLVVERGAEVIEKGALRPGETYTAALRLRLDLNQLPKPFQIAALGSRDWTLASDWKSWRISLPPLPPVAPQASPAAPAAASPAPAAESR